MQTPGIGDATAHVHGAVLVVDDDEAIRHLFQSALSRSGHEVFLAEDAARARAMLESPDAPSLDAAILDVMMPGESGLDLLVWLRQARPQLPIIISTASDSAKDAMFAMRQGAFEYLVKPTPVAELLLVVRNAVEKGQMTRELAVRRTMAEPPTHGAQGAIFVSAAMRRLMATVEMVKDSNVPIMLLGETGTGKEVVARTIHQRSNRGAKAFVPVNCAALPRELADSEVFGHEKGSFTGAVGRRLGRFEEADGGTLFLDEVAELDLAVQAKLLRVLQESEFTRVGGTGSVKVDTRLVVATHRDIRAMVKQGTFREDLYYRLNVIMLALPPLRERREELASLAAALLRRFAESQKQAPRSLSSDTVALLQAHTWPGNVRELENTLKRSVLLSTNIMLQPHDIQWEPGVEPPIPLPTAILPAVLERAPPPVVADVPAHVDAAPPGAHAGAGDAVGPDGSVRSIHEMEPVLMMRALAETHGNVTEAAKKLGIGRATFYRWAQRYALPI